ncbi:hypothetical protein K466DRAFT_570823, partial [Polyporus arcularius HHB13444]
MDYIPEPFVGLVQVKLRSDCRYGPHDPLHWPQLYSPEFEFLCALRRRRTQGQLETDPLWRTPQEAVDFELIEGTIFKCFRSPQTYLGLSSILRGVQRYCLMICAFMEYTRRLSIAEFSPYETSECEFMGAFTTDPLCFQRLLGAGIPVWFIRHDTAVLDTGVVKLLTVVKRAENIPMAEWQDGAPPVYSGLVGEAHLASICRRALMYADVSRAPLLVRGEQGVSATVVHDRNDSSASTRDTRPVTGPTRNTRKARARGTDHVHVSHLRGRDKFVDPQHEWMPAALPAWQHAMALVNRSNPAKRGGALWGYW